MYISTTLNGLNSVCVWFVYRTIILKKWVWIWEEINKAEEEWNGKKGGVEVK